jgi:hypothetical protein
VRARVAAFERCRAAGFDMRQSRLQRLSQDTTWPSATEPC